MTMLGAVFFDRLVSKRVTQVAGAFVHHLSGRNLSAWFRRAVPLVELL